MCLCCLSPANSNSSVASEQEERGSLKTKYRAYITNSSVHPRTPSPCYKHTSPSSPSSFPPTPTGRAHPSSSSPPIATAHLSSPPLFLDQQIASVLYLLPQSLPPPLCSHHISFSYSHTIPSCTSNFTNSGSTNQEY